MRVHKPVSFACPFCLLPCQAGFAKAEPGDPSEIHDGDPILIHESPHCDDFEHSSAEVFLDAARAKQTVH